MEPIPSRTRRSLCAPLRRVSRAALTLLAITGVHGCTPGGGGVTPNAPPKPSGQAILGWGGNSSGQLGDGSNNQRLNPVTVPLRNLRSIAAGGDVSLGLTVDGKVWEWGGGKTAPTEVTGLTGIKAIAAGERHRLALGNDGKVWAWGENDRGQLGDGSTTARATPVQVVGLSDILSIAAGGRHSLAIGKGFAVLSWGANDAGQVGDGSTTDRPTPVTVPGVTAIALAAAVSHSVVLTTDAKVFGWGSNTECQLGLDPRNNPFDPINCSPHPTPVELAVQGRPATWGMTIGASNAATFVINSDSQVVGFGGSGDPTNRRGMCNSDLVLGAAVLIVPPVAEVAAGPTHALFVTSTGAVWGLGANLAGQLGQGATSVVECPTEIPATRVRGATQVAAGTEHSIALVLGTLDAQPATVNFAESAGRNDQRTDQRDAHQLRDGPHRIERDLGHGRRVRSHRELPRRAGRARSRRHLSGPDHVCSGRRGASGRDDADHLRRPPAAARGFARRHRDRGERGLRPGQPGLRKPDDGRGQSAAGAGRQQRGHRATGDQRHHRHRGLFDRE